MTLTAPTLQAFFLQRLIAERNSSPETIGAYRDTLRLLLSFSAATRFGRDALIAGARPNKIPVSTDTLSVNSSER